MTTNATNKRTITIDLPDHGSETVYFNLLSSVAISGSEVLPRKAYSVTLDASGTGSVDLPTPDATGDAAWAWSIKLPDETSHVTTLAYDVASISLADWLTAEATTESPSVIASLVAAKADKDADAVVGNLAEFDGAGNPVDAESSLADLQSEIDSDISTHAGVSDAHHVRYTDTEAQAAAAETTFINSISKVLWGTIEAALTWSAAQIFSAAVTINEVLSVAASKSAALMSIDQQGTGDIAEFKDGGTATVRIPDQGGLVLVEQSGGYQEITGLLGYDSEKERLVLQHGGHDTPVPVDGRNALLNYIYPVEYT